MAKISANLFRRMTLGMAMVSGIMLALEDSKITKDELVMLLNQLFVGLGAEVNFQGLSIETREDGSMAIVIPAEVLKKLSINL